MMDSGVDMEYFAGALCVQCTWVGVRERVPKRHECVACERTCCVLCCAELNWVELSWVERDVQSFISLRFACSCSCCCCCCRCLYCMWRTCHVWHVVTLVASRSRVARFVKLLCETAIIYKRFIFIHLYVCLNVCMFVCLYLCTSISTNITHLVQCLCCCCSSTIY